MDNIECVESNNFLYDNIFMPSEETDIGLEYTIKHINKEGFVNLSCIESRLTNKSIIDSIKNVFDLAFDNEYLYLRVYGEMVYTKAKQPWVTIGTKDRELLKIALSKYERYFCLNWFKDSYDFFLSNQIQEK